MPPPSLDALPWYRVLSIDLLLRVSKSTFLNPVLTWLYPLALRAQAFHYQMPPLRYGIFFALFVDFCWVLSYLNSRARNGWRTPPRHTTAQASEGSENEVEAELEIEEVVVVTGGSSGLGQIIAEMFALKGISVAVMDIKPPPMEGNYSIGYYECDVSDPAAVEMTAEKITQDLGPVTTLINSAVLLSSSSKLIDLSIDTIQREIGTNILGNFYTIKAFLPAMEKIGRGHIVTISSALGFCGPANLSYSRSGTYSTSKAALLSLHESLTAELGLSSPIKTTLVVPGQLYTPLFYGVETPSTFLAPVLEPLDIARLVVKNIEDRKGGEIYAPWWVMRGLPSSLAWYVRWIGGVDTAMEKWRGPQKFAKEQGIVLENAEKHS